MNKYLKINEVDNVIVALQDLNLGEVVTINNTFICLKDKIPAKHKFYEYDCEKDTPIFMYGVLVGKTLQAVLAGTKVTTANLKHQVAPFQVSVYKNNWKPLDISKYKYKTFDGFIRADGKVGTANYWLFIPTVFCENRNMDIIKETLQNELGYAVSNPYKNYTKMLMDAYLNGEKLVDSVTLNPTIEKKKRFFENIDGIKFLNHQGGCGGTRKDAAVLSKLLASYADHPNVAGITILSLGCQNLQMSDLIQDINNRNQHFSKPMFVFEQQAYHSEYQLICDAIKKSFAGIIEANKQTRKPSPLSNLCIGVKCGGSDGFSGISANPAVGYCADILVSLGGQVLLAEFPELCGVEQELINRMIDPSLSEKFITLIQSYQKAALAVGSGFDMNPSPGNIKDGLITDAMKSAGAAKKGGNSPIVDVLDYTEPAIKKGLHLVCTPGNDVEATTGKVAAGATLILFTTGLGTPTGNPICPTIKISSNTKLANNMPDLIDIDAGLIIEGKKTIEEMGEEIFDLCIKVASGEIIPKAVQLNQDDFIPWKRGISL
ncbi:MAG: altronate dehydratase family protein [Sediminibacterium sp.]|nr:altronate dehydratase family protein [Sediminibacterium sp.]